MDFSAPVIIHTEAYYDTRGFFTEAYNRRSLGESGFYASLVQDNLSFSKRAVIRGLHYQPGQGKLVKCVKGEILDVVVDFRENSPTYGEHERFILKEGDNKWLWVPPMYAHGFQVLSEDAYVLYKATDYHNPETEGGIHYTSFGINWFDLGQEPNLSERDRNAKVISKQTLRNR